MNLSARADTRNPSHANAGEAKFGPPVSQNSNGNAAVAGRQGPADNDIRRSPGIAMA